MAHFMTPFHGTGRLQDPLRKTGREVQLSRSLATLKDMNMLISLGDGHIPVYKRLDLTVLYTEDIFNFFSGPDYREIDNIAKEYENLYRNKEVVH